MRWTISGSARHRGAQPRGADRWGCAPRGGGVDGQSQEFDGLHELAGWEGEVFKKESGPWSLVFGIPMVYSVLPMVGSTVVLPVIMIVGR